MPLIYPRNSKKSVSENCKERFIHSVLIVAAVEQELAHLPAHMVIQVAKASIDPADNK